MYVARMPTRSTHLSRYVYKTFQKRSVSLGSSVRKALLGALKRIPLQTAFHYDPTIDLLLKRA